MPPGIRWRGRKVTDTADLVHVLVAVALTYALGFERDLRGSAAGDRVFALIGIAAGLVGVFAVHGSPNALQGVLTGIGFTGAAVVFRQDLGRVQLVRGLTTAAALFAAVAIGAAAGEGRLLLAAQRAPYRAGVAMTVSFWIRPAMSWWTASADRVPSTVNIHSRPA